VLGLRDTASFIERKVDIAQKGGRKMDGYKPLKELGTYSNGVINITDFDA
jgi:3-deoxy-D-arabino-heptulosonate 7-phosphate (DAHP) synthase